MTAAANVGPSQLPDEILTHAECEDLLRRTCFGHLTFAREGHLDVLPVRYAFVDRWVYFRADVKLREVIAAAPWLVLSVTEAADTAHFRSVVVHGGCYETENTGSMACDEAALRGIMDLRDRPSAGRLQGHHLTRTSTVFRLHCDQMRGVTTYVPCPAGARPFDASELQHIRDAGREHTVSEDERGDDDGMAQQSDPAPPKMRR
jgi:nitroimidazol reductase NimA-like FMN-containing flavoprotein (pyridoxamine 5'-phosphate oxidase superfamily)